MAKKDYTEQALKVLELVGGEDNVTYFAHCMTRLRFNVADKSKVQTDALGELDGFSGSLWSGDQLQVIVGMQVNSVYEAILANSKLTDGGSVDENLDAEPAGKREDIPGAVVTAFSECMAPIIPYLVGAGMFSALAALIGPSGFGLVAEESNIYQLFYCLSQGAFYFFPMAATITASRKFGCNIMYALLLCALLMYPDFMALVQAGGFSCYGIPVTAVTYSSNLLPMIISCWLMSYVEKAVSRLLPDSLKTILEGVITLLIMLPVTLCVVGPLGTWLGYAVSAVFNALYSVSAPLGSAFIGFIWLLAIIPGMHSVVGLGAFLSFMEQGVNYNVFPEVFSVAFLSAAACLAVVVRSKDAKLKELGMSGIVSCLVGGVVEPALYSIFIKYRKVLVATLAGMAVTGLINGILGVGVFAFTSSNFLAILGYAAGGTENLMHAIIAIAVGCALTFGMIMVLGVEDNKARV